MIKYLSRLKAAACIAVVILHTYFSAMAFADTTGRMSTVTTARNLMMWAVPCFVMCTGALLLQKERKVTMKKLFGTYIKRMAVTLIAFTMLFSLFDYIFVKPKFSFSFITEGLKNIAFGTGWAHMWYLYLMIAVYLLLPAYRLITRSAKDSEIRYLLLIYGVFQSLLPFIETISGKDIAFYVCTYTVYPFYLLAGYALHKGIIKIPAPAAAVCTAVFAVITIPLTIYGCKHTDSVIGNMLYNYSFPLIMIGSLGVYSLFLSTEGKESVLDKACAMIEKYSFGIYLVHMAVLKFIAVVFKFNPFGKGGFFALLIESAIVFIVSYGIVFLWKKAVSMIPKKQKA